MGELHVGLSDCRGFCAEPRARLEGRVTLRSSRLRAVTFTDKGFALCSAADCAAFSHSSQQDLSLREPFSYGAGR